MESENIANIGHNTQVPQVPINTNIANIAKYFDSDIIKKIKYIIEFSKVKFCGLGCAPHVSNGIGLQSIIKAYNRHGQDAIVFTYDDIRSFYE